MIEMVTMSINWAGHGSHGRVQVRKDMIEGIKQKHNVTEIQPRSLRAELLRSRPNDVVILFIGLKASGASEFVFAYIDASEAIPVDFTAPPSTPRVPRIPSDRPE